jgi:maleylacetate reductase
LSGEPASFTWRDAGRTVLFGAGRLDTATSGLAEHGFEDFELLSTERALADAAELSASADAVHEVPHRGVSDAAAAVLDRAEDASALVAFGGGRVIDTAKAVAAVTGARVAAIPTTLSGAEMTSIHRLPAGAEKRAKGLVRPALAIADPEPMTSLPEDKLRFSAMNSLAHGADSLYTPYANPLSRMAALRGAELIAASLDEPRETRDRTDLALGSILCGYAIDSGLFAIHHVICQTLVRELAIPHAETNAAILPEAMAFMSERAPQEMADLSDALGTELESLPQRIRELGRPPGLGDLDADRASLDTALEAMTKRPELGFTPDPPGREHLRAIVEAAW